MSAADVISLISGIIAIIDASLKLYDAIDDASGLPQSFRDVSARLPLVQNTLETASSGLTDETDARSTTSTSRTALTKVLESCRDKAAALQKVLQAVIPATNASRMTRYLKALRTIPNADKVETLMDGILGDLQVLTGNHAVKAATRAQVERLIGAAKEGEGLNDSSPTVSLHNASTGSQYVHSGQGNQNVSTGSGLQFNEKLTGPFYFGRTPE
ncbi:SesA protein [Hypoxylon rubiginosum]|uniref:SesA protein n=1 Tax=Hypoxylon rubiginosum TaxID=110542 RepID=A0ACB9YP55_9PEZI|nr:SesA protein [Hypoxylon rubiginosum]